MAQTCAVAIYMSLSKMRSAQQAAETWENRGPAVLRVTGFESTRIGCRSRVNWDLDVLILAFEEGYYGAKPHSNWSEEFERDIFFKALPPRVGPVSDVCFKIDFPARGLLCPVGKGCSYRRTVSIETSVVRLGLKPLQI